MLVVEEGKEAPAEKSLKSYPFRECIFLDLCASFAAILITAEALFWVTELPAGCCFWEDYLEQPAPNSNPVHQQALLPWQHHHPRGGAGAPALRLEASSK